MKTPSGLIIKKSRNGKGVFVTKNFLPEEKIFSFTGVLLSCEEDDDTNEETRNNSIRFNKSSFLSPQGTFGNFINHSCDPNTKIIKEKKNLTIVSIKPIAKGEELTFDYSTILAADDVWEMSCNCGSALCRGVVKKFKNVPKKLREHYIRQGMVPKYILSI